MTKDFLRRFALLLIDLAVDFLEDRQESGNHLAFLAYIMDFHKIPPRSLILLKVELYDDTYDDFVIDAESIRTENNFIDFLSANGIGIKSVEAFEVETNDGVTIRYKRIRRNGRWALDQ